MTKENIIPKTETVYELKAECKVPSFAEFMQRYEYDGNLNYGELSGGDIGEIRGYGPCIKNGELNYDNCHCSSEELDRQLKIIRNKRELEALERERRENEESKKKQEEETKRSSLGIPSDYFIVDGMVNPKYMFVPELSPFNVVRKLHLLRGKDD